MLVHLLEVLTAAIQQVQIRARFPQDEVAQRLCDKQHQQKQGPYCQGEWKRFEQYETDSVMFI